MLKLLVNMVLKYKSVNEGHRRDAFNSAQLLAIISSQYFDKGKTHYKQIDSSITEVCQWVHKQKEQAEPAASQDEIQRYLQMFQKFRKGQFPPNDLLQMETMRTPRLILENYAKIEAQDHYQFLDGIDADSFSYKYFNSLHQFRVEYAVSTYYISLSSSFC